MLWCVERECDGEAMTDGRGSDARGAHTQGMPKKQRRRTALSLYLTYLVDRLAETCTRLDHTLET